jgi:hypothetical protein
VLVLAQQQAPGLQSCLRHPSRRHPTCLFFSQVLCLRLSRSGLPALHYTCRDKGLPSLFSASTRSPHWRLVRKGVAPGFSMRCLRYPGSSCGAGPHGYAAAALPLCYAALCCRCARFWEACCAPVPYACSPEKLVSLINRD